MKYALVLFNFAVLMALFSTPVVIADEVPSLPIGFYGSVIVGGNPAPSGTVIAAMIDGRGAGSITTTESGKYGNRETTLYLLVSGSSADFGKTISFFIRNGADLIRANENSVYVNVLIPENANKTPQQVDLTFPGFCGDSVCAGGESCSSCSADCGSCPSGGGGGGEGGGGGGVFITPCTPNWSCTDWSTCLAGTQTRVCTDRNNCGTTTSKPAETQACEMPVTIVCQEGEKTCRDNDVYTCQNNDFVKTEDCEFGCSNGKCNPKPVEAAQPTQPSGFDFSSITGFVTENPVLTLFGILILVIIVIIIAMVWKFK